MCREILTYVGIAVSTFLISAYLGYIPTLVFIIAFFWGYIVGRLRGESESKWEK